MGCGCGDRCTCSVTAGANIVVEGTGDAFTPYVISGVETLFQATSTDNSVAITPGGSDGHSPNFSVAISSVGGNLVTRQVDGLYVGATALAVATRYIGELIETTGVSTPGLTLETDGAEYAIDDYPELAGEYGATGIGDGLWDNHPQLGLPAAGNFRTPDLRRRSTLGKGASDTIGTTDAVTYASRSNSHTHTGPSHTHTVSATGANVDGVTATVAQPAPTPGAVVDDGVGTLTGDVALTGHTHNITAGTLNVSVTGSTSADGTGATGSALTPYAVVRKVVFAGV